MTYEHPTDDNNLRNLHRAMTYNGSDEPAIRTTVTGVTINGDVNVDKVKVEVDDDHNTISDSHPVPISGNASPNSNSNPLYVNTTGTIAMNFADGANITSFGRSRTSSDRILGEYRYQYGEDTEFEMNDYTVGSGSISIDYNNVCALGTVSTANNDRAVRQTKQYHPYIPGTSNLYFITFVMSVGKANLVQQVGAFDDQNGIFFRMNGVTPQVVVRKNGSDNVVSQAGWNQDTLDGNGPSGINLDFSKAQILTIDYQWLGVGRARIGFVVNGLVYYAHHFNHANIVTSVYMSQPSLPVRWEIKNTGITSGNSTLMMICAGVYCEGSDFETGWQRSVSTGATTINLTSVNSGTYGRCILAVKLTNSQQGKENRSMARLKGFNIITDNDIRYRIVLLPNSTSVFSGSPTWNDIPGAGWTQYTVDAALESNWQALTSYSVLYDDFALGTKGNNNAVVGGSDVLNRISTIFQNYACDDSQCLAIIGYHLSNNAATRASMNWLEVK